MSAPPLVLLGLGDAGRAVVRAAAGRRVTATTRSPAREGELRALGVEPIVSAPLAPAAIAPFVEGADVIVTFPPDGATDARVAPACERARAIVYVSSTGVYGATRGTIDDLTPPAPDGPRAEARLDAEAHWRSAGAIVLRAPALYGVESGLHVRLRAGGYRMPGDGSGVVSRIHTDDLAALLLAALARGRARDTFVVGDLAPTAHAEVVAFVAARLGLPLPVSAPLAEVSPTLRGSRAVDPSRALRELGVTLRYPSYREGYEAVLAAEFAVASSL